MTGRRITTGLPFDRHRATPPAMIGPFAQGLRQSGVDCALFVDELNMIVPDPLWRPDLIPMAAERDAHSTHDAFLLAAMTLAHEPNLSVRVSTDAIRNGPAELMRAMLTLASATEGDAEAICCLGAGEMRQIRAYGYNRAEGLRRLEDHFKLVNKFWDEDEPFDFDGNFWHLRDATLGKTKDRRPRFHALGGGPKLIDIAARYADGFETGTPSVAVTPEQFAERVRTIKEKVESYGRDPDQFAIGTWMVTAVHEDPDEIARVFATPVAKAFAALFGRFQPNDWRNEGLEPVAPEGFHYGMHWTPQMQSAEEIEAMVANVPDEMVERSFHHGSPAELGARAQEFVEAGADFVLFYDLLPLLQDPSEHPAAFGRNLAACAALAAHAVA